MRLGTCLLLLVCTTCGAADDAAIVTTTFDFLPPVAYESEPCSLSVRAGPGENVADWQVEEAARMLSVERSEDSAVLTVSFLPRELTEVVITAKAGQRLRCVLVRAGIRPGRAGELMLDADGNLCTAARDRVVLVLTRKEAEPDRRWAILRSTSERKRIPCTRILSVPTVGWGRSPLLAQVVTAQTLPIAGEAVLVQLGGADVDASWKHRAYRQCVAWLAQDLVLRGAERVAFVEPVALEDDAETLWALCAQVADVGAAYDCDVIPQTPLAQRKFWTREDGSLGTSLNDAGLALYRERCAASVSDGLLIPAP